jgi:hypothetical protein
MSISMWFAPYLGVSTYRLAKHIYFALCKRYSTDRDAQHIKHTGEQQEACLMYNPTHAQLTCQAVY